MNNRKKAWMQPEAELTILTGNDLLGDSTERIDEGFGDTTTWDDLFRDQKN